MESETYLFFEDIPSNLPSESFVGMVEVRSSNPDPSIRGGTLVEATVAESRTHKQLVGEALSIRFAESSCGPKLRSWRDLPSGASDGAPKSGLVIGHLSREQGRWVLSPLSQKYGGTVQARESPEDH